MRNLALILGGLALVASTLACTQATPVPAPSLPPAAPAPTIEAGPAIKPGLYHTPAECAPVDRELERSSVRVALRNHSDLFDLARPSLGAKGRWPRESDLKLDDLAQQFAKTPDKDRAWLVLRVGDWGRPSAAAERVITLLKEHGWRWVIIEQPYGDCLGIAEIRDLRQ